MSLGPEFAHCQQCGALYRTGDFEWSNLDLKGRAEFIFTEDIIALLALLGVCIWAILGGASDETMRDISLAGSYMIMTLLAILWFSKIVSWFYSTRRTNKLRQMTAENS